MVELKPCIRCNDEVPDFKIELIYDDMQIKVWIIKCMVCGNTKSFETAHEFGSDLHEKAYTVWNEDK